MPNHFWPQDLQAQSDQKISTHTRKHLYIPVLSGHSSLLGHLKSKKICILTKSCSIESSSKKKKKDSKCNLLLRITIGNLQKLVDATAFVLQVKFATSLQLWTVRRFSSFHSHRSSPHLLSDNFQLTKQLVPAARPPSFYPTTTPNSWLPRF